MHQTVFNVPFEPHIAKHYFAESICHSFVEVSDVVKCLFFGSSHLIEQIDSTPMRSVGFECSSVEIAKHLRRKVADSKTISYVILKVSKVLKLNSAAYSDEFVALPLQMGRTVLDPAEPMFLSTFSLQLFEKFLYLSFGSVR